MSLRQLSMALFGQEIPFTRIHTPLRGVLAGCEMFIRMFHLFDAIRRFRGGRIPAARVPDVARALFHSRAMYPALEIKRMHRLLSTELCRGNDNYFGIALPDEVLHRSWPTSVVAASYAITMATRYVG